MPKPIIGVMGPGGGARQEDKDLAFELGRQIAQNDWILLTGGRDIGVMHAALHGAKSVGGLTVGVLPSSNLTGVSEFVDVPIRTGMGSARNNINVLSSDVVVACGTGAGTTSEIMLAVKAGKPVILLNQLDSAVRFFSEVIPEKAFAVQTVQAAVEEIQKNI